MAGRDPLSLCADLPLQAVAAGDVLIEEGLPTNQLYVLKEGAFEVVRGGVRVIAITEPGAIMGEISVLLGSTPMASVIATQPSVVHVVVDAGAAVQSDPALTLAIAQLLARRLLAVTAYLVDIKRQYEDTDTHLALMDQVLANLMAMQPAHPPRAGSAREDVPHY